jgi:DNA-binding response OmpR family regulator
MIRGKRRPGRPPRAGRVLMIKELELLVAPVGTPGRLFGRAELLDLGWGHDGFVEPRTVDVNLARLRAKFTAANLPARGIATVRRSGIDSGPGMNRPAGMFTRR